MVRAYFIQYKFIVPETIKHSSYTYQKLFRALYGYMQNVSKSNGKSYKYHRKGVLSGVPYLRPGKNCVIIPPQVFSPLIEFFKTGKNPTHRWAGKGDWKAVYYMNEKELPMEKLIVPLEELLDRTFIGASGETFSLLESEMDRVLNSVKNNQTVEEAYKKALLAEAQKITTFEWFALCTAKSPRLKKFANLTNSLKST